MRNVALPQTHFHQAVTELILTSHSARKRPISTPNVEAKRRSSRNKNGFLRHAPATHQKTFKMVDFTA
jgi:hypothetical protein